MLDAFKAERSGCLIGAKLAERHGFKVGDTITIKGDIYYVDLVVKVVGIYDGAEPDWLIFQMKYLDELMDETVRPGTFFALVESPERVDTLLPELEAMFRNSDAEVKAETEKAFQLSFVEMLGNIKSLINTLVSVVVFAVLMIAASTMALAIRDRTREVATLKAIGFSRGMVLGLIVGEGMVVSIVGGGMGVLLSYLLLPQPRWLMAVGAGFVVSVVMGLPLLILSVLLPEFGTGGLVRRMMARLRAVISDLGAPLSILAGCIVTLLLLRVIPATDWVKFSGGAIQSLNVRPETLMLGIWITLGVGLVSSLIPAWQAARMSVLDGLRTLE
jgi:ABC-type lipoprotein release transport system permease subunit